MESESGFLLLQTQLGSQINKRVDSALSAHGISFTEYQVMHYLAKSALNAMPRIELAERIGLTASGVTRLLLPMEKNRLVEKEVNPRDARQSLVKLSSTGERVYEEARVAFEHRAEEILSPLTPVQRNKLTELMAKLVRI